MDGQDGARRHRRGRVELSRAEQRYNYALAVGAVLLVVVLTVLSPQVVIAGRELPVFITAVLVAAFLFGAAQMAVGIARRRRYLSSLGEDGGADDLVSPGGKRV